MCSFLLRKALPFTLTFLFGIALSGLAGLFGGGRTTYEAAGVPYGFDFGRSHNHCRASRRYLVAESRPLVILFKPDARRPQGFREYGHGGVPGSALVRVTFGADGKVQAVEPFYEDSWGLDRLPLGPDWKDYWANVERSARLIQFTPEMKDGLPVTVTKELEIFFLRD